MTSTSARPTSAVRTTDPPVTRPWDPPGLPPRTDTQRCAYHHDQCAYRDDDPTRCPRCHRDWDLIATATEHPCEQRYGAVTPDSTDERKTA